MLRLPLVVLAVVLALLALASGSASSSRAASGELCRWQAAAVEDPRTHLFDRFDSVTVTPTGTAWAVGNYYTGHEGGPNGSFIERWKRGGWHLVGRPLPDANLWSVSASSPDNAWALGDHLLEHWNGHRWHKVATAPVQDYLLWSVAIRGPAAWLVGERWDVGHGHGQTLVERWNGSRWTVVPTPNPPAPSRRSDAILRAVSVRSDSDVWAVGYRPAGPHMHVSRTLIEHWDGTRWQVVPSPSVRAPNGVLFDILFAVAADRADDAWAVGSYESDAGTYGGGGDHALVLHWNGRRWSRATLPAIRARNLLNGVAARGGAAWAVGDHGVQPYQQPLIEHWNGAHWTKSRSPKGFDLAAVATQPHGRTWAVGAVGRHPLATQLVCGQR